MRFAANFLLTIFFIVLSLIVLLAGALKFQILDFHFWQNTFSKDKVYQNLAASTKNSLETQIAREGGSRADAKVLTDLVTAENVKDLLDKNIQNILTFANGRSPQIIVYLPIDKFPKGILPKNLAGIKSEVPLKDLLTKFNYQNYSTLPISNISHAGEWAKLIFLGSLSLLAVAVILLVLLVKNGESFIAPGIAFLITGTLIIFVSKFGGSLGILSNKDLPADTPFTYILTFNVLPPLIIEILKTWFIVGVTLLGIGLVLFFVKKPGYNNPK